MKKLISIILTILFLVTLVAADEKISTELQAKMNAVRSDTKIPVIVVFEGMPSFEEVAQEYRFLGEQELIKEQVIRVLKDKAESLHYWLKQMCENMRGDISDFRSIWIANAVSINATPSAIQIIATQPGVEKVVLDEPVPMLVEAREIAWGVSKVNAPNVWSTGYTGLGVSVAVIDTGVNEHPDLKGRVVDGKNYVATTTPPRDDHGHGTHCSGTIAGDGAMGTATGVAPKATIIAVKVLDSGGSGQWSNLWLAIEEAVQYKCKVLSMSLGGKPDQTTRDTLRKSCKTAIDAGIIPVIAAGNSGSSANTIGSPGDVPEIISVGATDSNDNIAYFSSRGPTTWGTTTYIKPDVSAPGVTVKSCSHNSSGYTNMSGTSMATPHVAGVVALMVHARPSLVTETAKAALEATATDLGTAGKDNVYGSGRVNADKAVNAAKLMTSTSSRGDERWEMVVKEMTFNVAVDGTGNINVTQTIANDMAAATVTIWVDVKETSARQGYYYVTFKLNGPNGEKTGTARIDYDNIPTDPNKYDAKYGFNCGNFDLVKGSYVGTVTSIEPNPKVTNVNITITGKATWPAR